MKRFKSYSRRAIIYANRIAKVRNGIPQNHEINTVATLAYAWDAGFKAALRHPPPPRSQVSKRRDLLEAAQKAHAVMVATDLDEYFDMHKIDEALAALKAAIIVAGAEPREVPS
jgi:hypothetical protein